MSIIKMFVQGVGVTTLQSASIDVPAKGFIRTITLGLAFQDASPAIKEGALAELSFLSTAQFTSNDGRGSLCQVNARTVFQDAARLGIAGVPFCVLTPVAVAVNAGERIYLHGQADAASIDFQAVAYLFIDDGIDVARPQVRRR